MNKNKILGIIAIVVILAVIGFLHYKTIKESGYSVVYVTSGEVYVGKLNYSTLELTDGYIFQVIKDAVDPEKNNFQLQPLKDALWAPQSLHFVKDNIIFYGPLSPESEIAKTLAEQTQ